MSATPDAVRGLVRDRAMGLCERCGRPGTDAHHRQPRGMGGTTTPLTHTAIVLVWLCRNCHHTIETHRTQAYADGWLVHSWDDPRPVPIPSHTYRMPVWLNTAGDYLLEPPTQIETSPPFIGHVA